METTQKIQTEEKCYNIFQERLNERLRNPEVRKRFEGVKHKVRLGFMLNELLQETGNEEYCVEIMGIDEY